MTARDASSQIARWRALDREIDAELERGRRLWEKCDAVLAAVDRSQFERKRVVIDNFGKIWSGIS